MAKTTKCKGLVNFNGALFECELEVSENETDHDGPCQNTAGSTGRLIWCSGPQADEPVKAFG